MLGVFLKKNFKINLTKQLPCLLLRASSPPSVSNSGTFSGGVRNGSSCSLLKLMSAHHSFTILRVSILQVQILWLRSFKGEAAKYALNTNLEEKIDP